MQSQAFLALMAVAAVLLPLPGLAQPGAATPPPAAPLSASPAPSAAPAQPRMVDAGEIKVRTGNIFQIGADTYVLAHMRAPRISNAACQYERTRGRNARKALRRVFRRGQVALFPSGAGRTPSGAYLVRATVNNISVRQLMLRSGTVLPRVGNERGNPWCLKVSGTPG